MSCRKKILREKGLDGVEMVGDEGVKIPKDEFDPTILEANHMTKKDDQIRKILVFVKENFWFSNPEIL